MGIPTVAATDTNLGAITAITEGITANTMESIVTTATGSTTRSTCATLTAGTVTAAMAGTMSHMAMGTGSRPSCTVHIRAGNTRVATVIDRQCQPSLQYAG